MEQSSLAQENFGKVVTYSSNATTLIGQVTVNGVAAGEGDVVAIYVEEELRGKQEVIVNAGIAWLNVQVHAKGGDETATFKVFHASANGVFHVPNFTVTISPALSVGSFGSPVIVEAVGDMTEDTTAPGAPTVIGMSPTTDTTPTLSGTAEAGSTVTVYDGGIELGTAKAGSDGAYTFTPGSALKEAKHIITAKATDRAGNTSEASGAFSLVIDLEVVAGESFGKVKTYTNIATTLIGQVTIDGEAAGVGDIVGIYVGEELRGKNEVIVNAGTAWLNAQVHAAGGDETATFKVYDASTGVTYDTIDLSVVIKPEGEVGSFGEPLLIKVVGGEPADTTAPVITLTGDAVVLVEAGTTYSDAGASASDEENGDLTGSIVVTSTVDTGAVGSYTVTYNVSDAAGNAAVEVFRTVNVGDTTAPVITLNGETTVTVEMGMEYEDAGAKATDSVDGDISARVEAVGEVNTEEVGEYQLVYRVSDSAGNQAEKIIRRVLVDPFGIPVVYANEPATVLGQVRVNGSSAREGDVVGIYVGDELRGKQKIQFIGGNAWLPNARVNSAGVEETVRFKVYDSSTGMIVEKSGSGAVIEPGKVVGAFNEPFLIKMDTEAPEIELSGEAEVTMELGAKYEDAGAKATDGVDGDLTRSIVVISNVETARPGTYRVSYNVKDSAGNEAGEVVRVVVVNPRLVETLQLVVIQRQPFTFSFMAQIGVLYEVDASKDLQKWIKVKEINGTDGTVQFTDDRNINQNAQFYRLRIQ